jgi:hypothetical protein
MHRSMEAAIWLGVTDTRKGALAGADFVANFSALDTFL